MAAPAHYQDGRNACKHDDPLQRPLLS